METSSSSLEGVRVTIRIKDLQSGDVHQADLITALCKYLSGTAEVEASEVHPKGYEEDLRFILNEIKRLKGERVGVMSVSLRAELNRADKELIRDLYPVFAANNNQPLHGEELAVRLQRNSSYVYDRWLVSNLTRRFRELREMGYLSSPRPGFYQIDPAYRTVKELEKKAERERTAQLGTSYKTPPESLLGYSGGE